VCTHSRLWKARALPEDGQVVALELDLLLAQVSRCSAANLSSKIKVLGDPAYQSMKNLHLAESFDLVFIDAAKQNNTRNFIEAKRLGRKGQFIVRSSDSVPSLKSSTCTMKPLTA
ncbi:hypothetical protein R3P38DRAFT_2511416, partial [Favolaschia claudopus]